MNSVKLFLLVAVAVCGLSLLGTFAKAEDEKAHAMTGVLIDNACGDKKTDEADAAKHTTACCKKDSCAASGYQLMVGDKHYKFDDKGNDQAKAYLEKAESTKVTVEGTMEGDKMQVTSIKAAEKEKEADKKEGDKKEEK